MLGLLSALKLMRMVRIILRGKIDLEWGAKTRCVWVSVKYTVRYTVPHGLPYTLHASNNNIPHTDSGRPTCRTLSVNSLQWNVKWFPLLYVFVIRTRRGNATEFTATATAYGTDAELWKSGISCFRFEPKMITFLKSLTLIYSFTLSLSGRNDKD